MIGRSNSLLDNHPVPAYAEVVRRIINFQPTIFPYLIVLAELAVGIGLIFGFLTPFAAIIALFLNFNYITVSGVKPKDLSVNEC